MRFASAGEQRLKIGCGSVGPPQLRLLSAGSAPSKQGSRYTPWQVENWPIAGQACDSSFTSSYLHNLE